MKINLRKYISLLMAITLAISFLTGCIKSENVRPNYEFITVDVFSSQANFQGIQSGWFAKVVKDKFNMELNIIAPNVAGGGDTLFQTRAAAGELGDIVMISTENGRLEDLIKAELLLDMSPYTDLMPNIMSYTSAADIIAKSINTNNSIYSIPSSLTSYEATEPSEGIEPTFGPYLRWELYTEIGSPSMTTLEDLLPVLKEMQEIYPVTSDGTKTYAFSLFKDWDDNMMMMGKQPTCFYGYDEIGFLLSKADGSDVISIIEEKSPYIRAIKLYYEANQIGLVDPESISQSWDDVWNKYVNGSIIFSPWPWLGQSAYNTVENMTDGRGFMLAPIDDMQILSFGATPVGNDYVVGIGSKAEDPERMMYFIDWLYSPEGILMSTSQTGSSGGPEGLTWAMVNERPELTVFGVEAMLEGGATLPEDWGGGSWNDGTSQLNFLTVLSKDINNETNFPYDFRLWESYLEFTATPIHKSWSEKTGALTTFEYLKNEGKYIVAPGIDYVTPAEPIRITTLRDECKKIIVDQSWKMVFASNQMEFDGLLLEMQEKVIQLGYKEVLEYDLKIADEINGARNQVVNSK